MAGMKRHRMSVASRKWRLPTNLSARLKWELARAWARIGWAATIGGVFCVLALLALWQTSQLDKRHQVLEEKLRAAETTTAAKPAIAPIEQDLSRQLAEFYAYLPPHEAIPDQLKSLINLADKSGVTLAQAEYKPQPEVNADFLRYQIMLPVKADYPKVQAFILGSLQELPTLTLESVSFKRDRIESDEVEARIQYALLVRKRVSRGAAQ